MDVILKWIGGGTVVAALVLAGVAVGGRATAEAETPDVVAAAPEPAVDLSVRPNRRVAAADSHQMMLSPTVICSPLVITILSPFLAIANRRLAISSGTPMQPWLE